MHQLNRVATSTTNPSPDPPHSDLPLTRSRIDAATRNEHLTGTALVIRSEMRLDRGGKPYVALMLRCSDGATCEARWWRFPYPAERRPSEGSAYHFMAAVDIYNGTRQLNVTNAQPIPDADLTPFLQRIHRPLHEMQNALIAYIEGLDPDMSQLVSAVLSGETLDRYCEWPAAQHRHGALRYGLLAHSLRVAELVAAICAVYGQPGQTDLPCDTSLAIAAALLHDVGKTRTLAAIPGAALPDAAERYDHVTLGALMVQAAASQIDPPVAQPRLDALLHAILAHHGRKEWGAPIEPQTPEAWLVHLADLADARLWEHTLEARQAHSFGAAGGQNSDLTVRVASADDSVYAGSIATA